MSYLFVFQVASGTLFVHTMNILRILGILELSSPCSLYVLTVSFGYKYITAVSSIDMHSRVGGWIRGSPMTHSDGGHSEEEGNKRHFNKSQLQRSRLCQYGEKHAKNNCKRYHKILVIFQEILDIFCIIHIGPYYKILLISYFKSWY